MNEKKSFDNLSDELKAKLRECRTEEELNKVLEEAGLDLDQDLLKAVVGGLDPAIALTEACRRDQCQHYVCRVDQSQPLCPGNCPTHSHV